MLMIVGAALTGLAAWLVLADAGVRPRDSRWAMGLHVVAAWLTLQGLAAPLGEFAFGVPQFQHIFHPILLSLAAGFAIVAMRLVLGPWWALGITAANFAFEQGGLLEFGEDGAADTRAVGVFFVSAIAVEIVARIFGTRNRTRFAIASGLAIGTVGLAGEWVWNLEAWQPWRTSMLRDAVIMSIIVAVGSAILAAAYARAAGRQRSAPPLNGWLVGAAAVAVVACIALPMPRGTGEVTADVRVERVDNLANLTVTLDPPNAAEDARWFQASSWQGGGLELSEFEKVGPGRYQTERPVPVSDGWKTLIRLHRGGELMAVPVFLPADPEIDEPEIPAVDRVAPFERESKYLLRETHSGSAWFAYVIYGLLLLAMTAWAAAFTIAVRKITPQPVSADGADDAGRGVGGADDSSRLAQTGAPNLD